MLFVLFDYFHFNGTSAVEESNHIIFVSVYGNFHQEMVISCPDIRIFSLLERPKFAAHVKGDYHQVRREKYGHLKHDRNKCRHVLQITETWLASDILRPI